jgi:fluoride ion exporter CrcB/FEX
MITAFGPETMLVVKIVAAVILAIGSMALIQRNRARSAIAWLAVIGFVGCFTELLAVA